MATYHLVGIKGSGMSALAQVLHGFGQQVQGSDVEKYFFTEDNLSKLNIPIYQFNSENIKPNMIVIAGNAFADNHPEIETANKLKLPIIRYHRFLGDLLKHYKSVAITGCHGKTSTTGLLAHVLKNITPTSYLIGDGTGSGNPEAKFFVFEACEYKRHFLSYYPNYCIMTNIDYDHPDYYQNIEDVRAAFQEMVHNTNDTIIAYGDDQYLRELEAKSKKIIYYGTGANNDLQARNIVIDKTGTAFEIYWQGKKLDHFYITSYGRHNILNTLAVITLCVCENLNIDLVKRNLLTFPGVKRRFSEKVIGNQILIDDYAHHPTEIVASIEVARQKYPEKKLVAIFQPHTYSRTVKFLQEFANSLAKADYVYLCDIFGSARESNADLTIQNLVEKIPQAKILSEQNIDCLSEYENACLLFMGAGDIQKYQVAYEQKLLEHC